MNPNLCRIALRPRSPLEVFDLSLRLMRERSGSYLRLLVLTVGVPALVLGGLAWVTEGHWAPLLAVVLVGPVVQAPFTLLSGRLLFQADVALLDVLREVVGALPHLLVAWLYEALAVMVGCGVGWIVTGTPTMYLAETALLERVSPSRGLQRSVRLAGAHPAVALTAAVSRVVLTLWCILVVEAAGQALLGTVLQLGSPFGSLWTDWTVTPWVVLGALIAQPLHAVYRLLLYVDVRTRVEGWDLQVGLRAAGLGAS